MVEAAIFVIFPFCMAFAAISDMLFMTITNRVSVVLIVSFVLLASLSEMSWPDVGLHLAMGIGVLALALVPFALGAMGGGDAKLMAATAAWFGVGVGFINYLLISALAGGILTLALMMFRSSPLSTSLGENIFLRHFANRDADIPYGVALGIGGLLAYSETPLMQWAMVGLGS